MSDTGLTPQPHPKKPSPGRTYVHRNRSVFVPRGMMAVGLIVGAHGLRGEVRVELHTDFPERFTPGNELFLGDDLVVTQILSARPHKNELLVLLEGVLDRAGAESLRGTWVFIDEQDAADLEDGAFWVHDIIGMNVQATDGRRLGRVTDVISAGGANDVYVVKPSASVNQGRELLLPAIPDVIQTVDLDSRLITVALIPGILDE